VICPTQRAFQADLVRHVAQLEAVIVPGRGAPALAAARGLSGREILRDTMRAAFVHTRDDPLFRVLMSFYAHVGHPERSMHDGGWLGDPFGEPDWDLATRVMVLVVEAMTMPAEPT
jgi:hypothetical protein